MSKKKHNRKKQLRKEQKEQKVVSLFPDDEVLFEQEETGEMVPHAPLLLIPEMIALRQGTTDSSIRSFTDFQRDMRLSPRNQALVNALSSENTKELVAALLEKDPDFLLARYVWVLESMDDYDLDLVQKVEDFYKHAARDWQKSGYGDFTQLDAQESLESLAFVLGFYLVQGFLSKALSVIQFILSKKIDFMPPGFIPMMLATYNRLFRLDLLEAYYKACAKKGQPTDTVLLHLAIAKFCAGRFDEAEASMDKLRAVNPHTDSVLADWSWIEDPSEIDEIEFYAHDSREALLVALQPLSIFIMQRPLLVAFLEGQAEPEEDGIDWNAFEIFAFASLPELEGIRWDKIRTLYHDAGIHKAEDFQEWTERELLALKGIGKVTIQKMKENGIRFKDG